MAGEGSRRSCHAESVPWFAVLQPSSPGKKGTFDSRCVRFPVPLSVPLLAPLRHSPPSSAFPQTPPSASPLPVTATAAPTSIESEPPSGPPPFGRLFSLPPPQVRAWYGYQTSLLDALSAGLLTVGIAKWNGGVGAAGAASFLLGPPIVHLAHGQGWKGVYDLGLLRVAEPLVSAGVGAAIGMLVGAKTGCGG
jgi:hypothetical protein